MTALQSSAAARVLTPRQRELAALYRGQGLARIHGTPHRIAVVGAGLAGLTAAHLLTLAGCSTTVFEASARIGGRIRTERGRDDSGAVWELGGEFIDSDHDDMHALADALGVEIFDTLPAGEDAYATAYHFGGQSYTEAQVEKAFAEIAPIIAADVASLSARPGYRTPSDADSRFDRMSIAEYLEGLKLDRWLHRLIEVAYVTVYGLDAGEQSALNLLTLIGTHVGQGFEIFGDSDERYKVRAGSQQLTDALVHRSGLRVALERRLVRLRRSARDWVLGFDQGADERADAVVLAMPFTTLRQLDLGDLLPPIKRLAVDSLGYGANSKLMLATRRPLWRDQGRDGGCYTDSALQTTWDCSRLRAAEGGVFTVFLGGREAVALSHVDEATQAVRHVELADAVFPGFAAEWTGETRRINWPDEPFALGAYTCYRPGQWTAFGGAEAEPLPNGLYFAGEHCALASQGYMNGAAETGRAAALAILKRLS